MGRIVEYTRIVRELILDDADYEKHNRRFELQMQLEERSKHTKTEESFRLRLSRCPFCHKPPKLHKCLYGVTNPRLTVEDYDYKFTCCPEFDMDCGYWYPSLAKAGLNWNRRTRTEQAKIDLGGIKND